jgi:hypothetical protein
MNEQIGTPRPPDVSEKSIVEALSEDVSLHGWKVTDYTVKQDLEREERGLTIKLVKSTGAEQGVLQLKGARKRKGTAEGETPED